MTMTVTQTIGRTRACFWQVCLVGVFAAGCMLVTTPADAGITRIEITSRTIAFGGYSFPGVGQFERIVGIGEAAMAPLAATESAVRGAISAVRRTTRL